MTKTGLGECPKGFCQWCWQVGTKIEAEPDAEGDLCRECLSQKLLVEEITERLNR